MYYRSSCVVGTLQLFFKPLAALIFATFGIAQTSLALHSLNAKIGQSVGSCGLGNVLQCGLGFLFYFAEGKKKTK
jgi:hypothetical protein